MRDLLLALLIAPSAGAFFTSCGGHEQKKETTPEVSFTKVCHPVELDDKKWYASGQKAALMPGLEGIAFPISTRSETAQRYFDQGMMLSYGFNHAEAARSFWQVTREDSTCAMGWWGFAYVLGPNYNAGMEPDSYQRAYQAIQKARALAKASTEKEQMLIEAMAERYPADSVADRKPFDQAYSKAMRSVHERFPDDPDIAAMYAESIMDQHPWDLWEKNGQPKSWTPEIRQTLEAALVISPRHVGLNHFYIHTMEASREPERAMANADLLGTLAPGAGHLVHMPGHIYMRTGKYDETVRANLQAIKVDSVYTVACHAQGIYPLAYVPHNMHFVAIAGMMEGNAAVALKAARQVRERAVEDLMGEPYFAGLQHLWCTPYLVEVKLGLWDSIMAEPPPGNGRVYTRALWHYARGMAELGRHDVDQAEVELDSLHRLAADTSLASLTVFGLNSMPALLKIAEETLRGELLAAQGHTDDAITALKSAVAREDSLNYDEPPDWPTPTRHLLGALQATAGQFEDAIDTYEDDLVTYRENGWALTGLAAALDGAGKRAEAEAVRERAKRSWVHADREYPAAAAAKM